MTAPTPRASASVTLPRELGWLCAALERATEQEAFPRTAVDTLGDGRCPRVAICTLRAARESAKAARDFTRDTLHVWSREDTAAVTGLDHQHIPGQNSTGPQAVAHAYGMDGLCEDIGLAASELVSNAVRHGLRGAAADDDAIRLGLVRVGSTVLCAVTDPGEDVPVVKEPDYFAETGRGLQVIASVSGAWGWTPPDSSGKVVWAMFSVNGQEH